MGWQKVNPDKVGGRFVSLGENLTKAIDEYGKLYCESLQRIVDVRDAMAKRKGGTSVSNRVGGDTIKDPKDSNSG